MSLFLITFFIIYGLMHYYAFVKARAAFPFNLKTGIPVVLFMLLMINAPIIVRYLERGGMEFAARMMSYTGYTWLGLIFVFISAALALDIYKLLIHMAESISGSDLSSLTVSARSTFTLAMLFSLFACCYGYVEAMHIQTERLTIHSPKIHEDSNRLRIVQVSDIHLGLIVREERLKLIISKIKEARPDILVSTGDLVDGQINGLDGLSELWKEINPKYGKYAVTGNHEYYAGLSQSLKFTEKAEFRILRGEGVSTGGIQIAGVDDATGRQFGMYKGDTENNVLQLLDRNKFTVLLKHRPDIDSESAGLFDLQLSGHTHKGQIFPFNLITYLYFTKHAGLLELAPGSHLYVSRGSGTWGPPIRFMSPPEITVIELTKEGA